MIPDQIAADGQRLFVIGGSNSILRGGWTHALAQLLGPDRTLINLSCGASSSMMGLYRFLENADRMRPGDVVIWEYALNDQNHCNSGQNPEALVRYVKWLVRLCHDRGLRFLPLILHVKKWHANLAKPPSAYHHLLEEFFQKAGIAWISDGPIIEKQRAKGKELTTLFLDNEHLRPQPLLMNPIAKALLSSVINRPHLQERSLQASIPHRMASLSVIKKFQGSTPVVFQNSLFDVMGYPLDRPLTVEAKGKILGLVLVTGTAKKALTIRVGQRQVGPISTQAHLAHVRKDWILKQISLDAAMPAKPMMAEGPIQMSAATTGARPLVQNTYNWVDVAKGQPGGSTTASVVAVLVEEGVPHVYTSPALTQRLRRGLRKLLSRLRRR